MKSPADMESTPGTQVPVVAVFDDEGIDLRRLLDRLLHRKWLALSVAAVVLFLGCFYAWVATPVYMATALMHVEKKASPVPGMEELQSLFSRMSHASAEIEIIQSRSVLRRVVVDEGLAISAQPLYYPLIGRAAARRDMGGVLGSILPFAGSFAWGGERVQVSRFDVPAAFYGAGFTLVALPGGRFELGLGNILLSGRIGEAAVAETPQGRIGIFVRQIEARPGTRFTVVKFDEEKVISGLQGALVLQEHGRATGIIGISLEGTNPARAARILNGVLNSYVRQNVEKRSEEASKMLAFLDEQLPEIKKRLETAESKLKAYKQTKGSAVDIGVRGGELLNRATGVEQQISALELERSELRLRFTEQHPVMTTLEKKLNQLKRSRNEIEGQLKKLPNTELESVRLLRNVQVANELYVQLLNRTQELRVAKAGTIGDARIVDYAYVPRNPVRPQVGLIVVFSFLLACVSGMLAVFMMEALRKTLDAPEIIEERLGLPVFATVPHSKLAAANQLKSAASPDQGVLSRYASDDTAVESLRSLRTSLQFALFEARNNIVAIHGPTPGVGKSFVATNLAFLLADIGKSVLLIDGDMRNGHIHRMLGLQRAPGLSDVLTADQPMYPTVTELPSTSVSFLATGHIPPNPSELLVHHHFNVLLDRAAKDFDYVVIDTPPTLNLADSIAIGRQSGTNFLVVRAALNTLRDVELSSKRLRQSGIPIDGVVFNDLSVLASKYKYGGYYGYKYKPQKT